jgi:dihydrofolate reductase
MIRAIFACDENWGIGINGTLPWPTNKEDLQWFKTNTTGGVVVMGKTTWDSLPEKSKPLPNRNNIVVTSSIKDKDGPYHFIKFENAKSHILSMGLLQNVWIIGGARLLDSLLDITEEVWLSRVKGTFECDTFLPKDKIINNFDMYEHYFDGVITIQKYKRIENEV